MVNACANTRMAGNLKETNMNRIFLSGNLCADPELKTTQGEAVYTRFRVATNDGWGDKQKTNFHTIVAWNKTAENVCKYLSKGSKVLVEGRIEYSEFEDKEGVKRYKTDIVASGVEFLDSKPKSGGEESPSSQHEATVSGGPGIDDIPF